MHSANSRNCLPCTACCQGWLDIDGPDFSASLGSPCPNCTSSGCQIYASRPLDPCQSFLCAWRTKDTALPEHMRPDLCGCIIIMDRLVWRDQYVVVGIPTGPSIPEPTVKWLMGLCDLTGKNLLLLKFNVADDRLIGTSKALAYGDDVFKTEMADRFKSGRLYW